jgi:signal transduction histidine kinase
LLARISATRERERRFTADAAHELRTPLAALRAQAQVAIRARNTDELQTALASILQGVDRSTHLVEQLLTLARLENLTLPSAPIEIGKLLRDAVGHASASAAAKGIDLGLGSAPENDSLISGQETLLSVALRNLLENAIRYTPAGGRVDLHCQQSGAGIALIVEDSGPGMDAEEQSRACQPFFRGSASENIAGSGLGLSIVARIAQLHGGSLAFAKSTLGGLAVILQLPLHSPPPS